MNARYLELSVEPEIMLFELPNIRLNLTFVATLLKQVNRGVTKVHISPIDIY